MAKYLVLYRSTATAADQMGATPEQVQEGMQQWMKWAEKAGKSLVDLGSPLDKSQLVGGKGEAGTPIGGFSILEADSEAAVGDLLSDHPHLHAPGAVIEVLEFQAIPGM